VNEMKIKRNDPLIVAKVAVVDDSRVEGLGVITNNFVCLFRNHTSRFSVLGVY
jgi:hypothetical protein